MDVIDTMEMDAIVDDVGGGIDDAGGSGDIMGGSFDGDVDGVVDGTDVS